MKMHKLIRMATSQKQTEAPKKSDGNYIAGLWDEHPHWGYTCNACKGLMLKYKEIKNDAKLVKCGYCNGKLRNSYEIILMHTAILCFKAPKRNICYCL